MSDRIDLEALARAKGLPADVLRDFGLSELPDGGVRVEYLTPEGGLARSRLRWALGGPEGSSWEHRELHVDAYWRPLVNELAAQRGVLLICEGESTCWTLWHCGFGAVGIPGAEQIGALRIEHMPAGAPVVLVLEPDDPQTYPRGRHHYLQQLERRLAEIGYAGPIEILDLDDVAEDLNALYRADPSTFAALLEELLRPLLRSRQASADGEAGRRGRPRNGNPHGRRDR